MKVIMKTLLLSVTLVLASGAQVNPLEKVLQMLSDLQTKLIAEGQQSQNMYSEFSDWCEKRSQELHFEIKTGKSQVSSLNAAIEKGTADGGALEATISSTAADISESESELKAATAIRKGDSKVFAALEQELVSTVDMVTNALSIVQKEMNGGAFLQTQDQSNAQSVVQAIQTMVEASSVSSSDATRLTALVQSQSSSEDGDEMDEAGAPSASAHESKSGGIVDLLQGLLDKAESQLGKARKEEESAVHEFSMKKQALEDGGSVATKELGEAKSGLAATQEKKAVNKGDLTTTSKDLQEDITELSDLHHSCLGKATDFEEEAKSRNDELGALAQAKKIITETTGGASSQTYGLVETSFVQVKASSQGGVRALRMVRRLAYSQRSAVLTQLASRIQSTLRFGAMDGASPFKKVQSMIMDMVVTLEKEAEAEATEKQYCDKELADTKEKLDGKTDDHQGLTTKIAQMEGTSKKLKGQVVTLQNELAAMAKAQAEMDQLRQKENAAYKKNKPEMEQGLNGVKKALKVLKEYYAQPSFVQTQTQSGTTDAAGIIGLLEVSESDFSKLVAEMIAEEEQAQSSYDEQKNENAVAKTTKDQDVKYKTKEAAGLDKGSAELKGDFGGVSDELAAVQQYDKELQGRCTKKVPSYEEIAKAREAEIAGLKEALTTLEGGAMFLQENLVSHRTLRGIHRA